MTVDGGLEALRVTPVIATDDPPSLRRLAALDGTWVSAKRGRTSSGPPPMGYQPGLDGLRAVSVVAVMLYHAGFAWMPGGFLGVEVFFVVSGYLITSLLLDERETNHRVSLGRFWLRRARRLFPALVSVLIAVATWAVVFGSDEQRSTLRRDLPWSIFYLGNWGQVLGTSPYFSTVDPPLLRHLWSLGVEEQWYIVWPLVFVAAMTIGAGHVRSRGTMFVGVAAAIMIGTSVANGEVSNNALYLNTITRANGLLLGAGCAFVWRPWRATSPSKHRGRRLDPLGATALSLLVCIMSVAVLTEDYVSMWLLPVVSVLSMAVIAVVVYPTASGMRSILGWKPLAAIGRRSYGLYLWHWPIFVIGDVYHSGSWARFSVAMFVTIGVSEVSFRYVETPIRKGFISDWLRGQRNAIGADRIRRSRLTASVGLGFGATVVALFAFYVSVDHYDAAVGGDDASFDISIVTDGAGSVLSVEPTAPGASVPSEVVIDNSPGASASAAPSSATAAATALASESVDSVTGAVVAPVTGESAIATSAPAAPTTLAVLPRRVVVVGDSQAHSLAINLPDGIGSTFTIEDGSVEGCGVYDTGRVISARNGFNRSFGDCAGWAGKWGSAASSSDAEVALVVVGAWDVFDLELADRTLVFATQEADAYYLAQLQKGIDALKAGGSHVALLEVPCMRPQDVKGAGVPALPERGDDARTGHLNDLLRQAAAADPEHVTFVAGPTQWCTDEAISTNLGYRWDGVHVYKPGANLIYETIAQTLLAIPVPNG